MPAMAQKFLTVDDVDVITTTVAMMPASPPISPSSKVSCFGTDNVPVVVSKRKRHNLTSTQIATLEEAFACNARPGRKARVEIGTRVDLDIDKVRKWFENRRNKQKKVGGGVITRGAVVAAITDDDVRAWQAALFCGDRIPADLCPPRQAPSTRSPGDTTRSSSSSPRRYGPVVSARSVRGIDVGEQVAPFVSELIFYVGSQIRERFDSDADAGQIIQAQEAFRISVERLFAAIRYDCRTTLDRHESILQTCCFAMQVTPYINIRIDCVAETHRNLVEQVAFYVHDDAAATAFSIGCRRADDDRAESWGDTGRLRRLLDIVMNDANIWTVLLFFGLGRAAISDTWLLSAFP